MRIVTACYELMDKFHVQNNQLSICNILALLDVFALARCLKNAPEISCPIRCPLPPFFVAPALQ
jgi:hypothetical protein